VALTAVALRVLLNAHVGWKLAIPHWWGGFPWDKTLARWDALLHGGVTPDRHLAPLLATDWFLPLMDRFYIGWFTIFAGIAVWKAWTLDGRYFLAMGLTWVFFGALVATMFASAGPCYFDWLGYGDTYAPLMSRVRSFSLDAVALQDMLWRAYLGEDTGDAAGIAAFPSIHVALPALYTAVLWRTKWRWPATVFWLFTLVGSVALGWHYALDGYVGTLGALICWWISGTASRTSRRALATNGRRFDRPESTEVQASSGEA
jgi:hypothetical protein